MNGNEWNGMNVTFWSCVSLFCFFCCCFYFQYKERLYATPFAQRAAENAKKMRERAGETSVGKGVAATSGTLRDAAEDIREQWETSQNPMVYRAQAVFDIALEETERARSIREVQRLDPSFDVEGTFFSFFFS